MKTIWKSAAGYVIGRSHEKEQKPCQDRTLVASHEGVSFIGLCDGAGSATHSHYGAERSLEIVSAIILNEFAHLLSLDEDDIKSILLERIIAELKQLADSYNVSLSSFASTLLFVASDGEHYISGHIGDGLIVAYGEALSIHSHADNGAYANVTYFTTSHDAMERFRIRKNELSTNEQTITGFCLMSDGTSSALYRKQDDVIAPALLTIASWLHDNDEQVVNEAITQNLHKAIRLKTFDDCSLAIMVKIKE